MHDPIEKERSVNILQINSGARRASPTPRPGRRLSRHGGGYAGTLSEDRARIPRHGRPSEEAERDGLASAPAQIQWKEKATVPISA
jgi:hypothetical protein